MKKTMVILDAGHGGFVHKGEINKGNLTQDELYVPENYTTVPRKMHKHENGKYAYEGMINRMIKNNLKEMLRKNGMPYYDVTETNIDLPLDLRVGFANQIAAEYQKQFNVVYLSIHGNASPNHNARGFEVYTSKGETTSDKIATVVIEEIKKVFPDQRFRQDYASDGDADKEANFYVLKNTYMPAVLAELLFFDNADDFKIIKSDFYLNDIAIALFEAVKRFDETLNSLS